MRKVFIFGFLVLAMAFFPSTGFSDDSDDGVDIPWERCGYIKGAIPVTDSLTQLIIDQDKRGTNTYYYNPKIKEEYSGDCAELTMGIMCFEILKKMPVTKALRDAGVGGKEMTIIHQCVVPD